MRQLIATTLAALGIGLMLAALSLPGAPRATARPFGPSQATATPPASLCVPTFNKIAGPARVRLGEQLTITLTAKVACPPPALHMVLVLPESMGVPAQDLQRIQDHAAQFVECLKLSENPLDQVAVVAYSGSARTLCALTNDERRLKACIRQLGHSGITAIDTGIDEGVKALTRGRPRDADTDAREVMVVYAGSGNAAGCGPVLSSAGRAKGQKMLLMALCAGSNCDVNCMRQVASSPRYFFELGDPWDCPVSTLRQANTVKRLTITDQLPPDMGYITDSADPPPASGDAQTGFKWILNYVPASGVTITLRVRPLETGQRATNVEATGELLDSLNLSRRFTFPVPTVDVGYSPSPTVPSATPSPTPSYTPTPPQMTCTPPPCPCGRLVGTCPGLRCEACTETPTPEPGQRAFLPRAECGR